MKKLLRRILSKERYRMLFAVAVHAYTIKLSLGLLSILPLLFFYFDSGIATAGSLLAIASLLVAALTINLWLFRRTNERTLWIESWRRAKRAIATMERQK